MSCFKIFIILLFLLPFTGMGNELVEQVQVVIDWQNAAINAGIKADLNEINASIVSKTKRLSQKLMQINDRYAALMLIAKKISNEHKAILDKDNARFSNHSFTKISNLLAEWRTLKLELKYLIEKNASLNTPTQKLASLQESLADEYLTLRNLAPGKKHNSKLFAELAKIGYTTKHHSFFDGDMDLFWGATTDPDARDEAGNVLNTVGGTGTLGILVYAAIADPEPITKTILFAAVAAVALVSYYTTAKIKTDQNIEGNIEKAKEVQDELMAIIFEANQYYLDNKITKAQMLTMTSQFFDTDEYQKIEDENNSLINKLSTEIVNYHQTLKTLEPFLKEGEAVLKTSYNDFKKTLIAVRSKEKLADFRRSQLHDAKTYSAAKYWHNTLPVANKAHSRFYYKHIEDCHLLEDHGKDMALKYVLYRDHMNEFKTSKNKNATFFTKSLPKIDDFIAIVKDDALICYEDQESVKRIPANGGIPAQYKF